MASSPSSVMISDITIDRTGLLINKVNMMIRICVGQWFLQQALLLRQLRTNACERLHFGLYNHADAHVLQAFINDFVVRTNS